MALYFAQITDIHVLSNIARVFPEDIERNVLACAQDLENLPAEFVLCTGDVALEGTEKELKKYLELAEKFPVPVYTLPGSHDVWNGPEPWEKLLGKRNFSIEVKDYKIICLDVNKKTAEGKWVAELSSEVEKWLIKELEESKKTLVAIHPPPKEVNGVFLDQWRSTNPHKFLSILREHNVIALITGHWHRNGEWTTHGVKVINTGPLCGWQWTGIPPFHGYPIRPGYRIIKLENRTIKSFWRDLYCTTQVYITHINRKHTLGPRPQVKVIEVSNTVEVAAKAYSENSSIKEVLLKINDSEWIKMKKTWSDLWSEWTLKISIENIKDQVLKIIVKTETTSGEKAYDATIAVKTPASKIIKEKEILYELHSLS